MKLIPVDNAVGMVLGHDITEIVPGRFKGPAFKRGHVIRPEDVNRLRDLGKENIAALDLGPGWLHEDDAAQRLATAAAGEGIVDDRHAQFTEQLGGERNRDLVFAQL